MTEFRGVIPPIITPFDANGGLEPAALARLIDWYVDAGCHGLWVCGGTGEGVSLSCDERLRMIELVAECVAGRLAIVFHVGAPTTSDALTAARRCGDFGIDAIASVPPYFYGKTDEETIAYYARLAEASDRPLFLYNLPSATGRPLDPRLVEQLLAAVPTIVGLKHSVPDLEPLMEFARLGDDLSLIIGRGELMLSALVVGAAGVTCSSICMAPERYVAAYAAFEDGDLRRAMEAQARATEVKELYRSFPPIAATKRVNSQQIGIDCGPPRPPLAQLDADQQERLLEMAEDLGLFDEAPLAVKKPR